MKCPECGGAGRIPHPLWTMFEQELGNPEDVLIGTITRWWRKKGYSDTPDPKIECPVCNGTGTKLPPDIAALEREIAVQWAKSKLAGCLDAVGTWMDSSYLIYGLRENLDTAIRYLDALGMLERHPTNPTWVRVREPITTQEKP